MKDEEDYLLLKWGTLKGWHLHSEKGKELLREYFLLGSSYSAMAQHDTPRQTELICLMIDECNGLIENDWSGEVYDDKEKAKEYITKYRQQ
jgi:hypothetical protein